MSGTDPAHEVRGRIAARKAALDARRPLADEALRAVRHAFDVELTYTSNAIEGNTLTLRETAEVIDHGLTVGGKRLRDHLEAVDHYDALLWTREIAAGERPLEEATICEMHRRIVARSQPDIAGMYSRHPRRIAGSAAIFPNAARIPDLMADLGSWLSVAESSPEVAFEAHRRLTAIHPFADGNGRTARLLANLVLIRAGYPPVAIRPEDRVRYLEALEADSTTGDELPFRLVMLGRLDETLAAYLDIVEQGMNPAARS